MELTASKYKQTEVGLIPEDWEVTELGKAVDFLDEKRKPIKSSERQHGIYPYYGASGIIDYVNDYIFDDELILFGEDGENILSRNLPLAFIVKGKVWVNNHAHVMKPNSDFDINFLNNFLESLDYSLLNSGTAQPKLNKQSCLKIKVVKPTLKEQKAIATVLSDSDALIQALEQKIAKKKLIKKGVMQQLLSRKIRLKGFEGSYKYKQTEVGLIPEDWEVKKLKDLLMFGSGQDYKHLKKGDVPVYGTGGIMTYVDDYLHKGDSVGIGRKGTIDKPVYLSGKFWTVDTLFYTHSFNNTIPKYIYYKFLLIQWKDYNEASGVPSLNKDTLGKIRISLPPTLEEQKAIAQILSDIDQEIENLEQKLSKYQRIKQGLMQQLLTGKVRLVV